MTGRGTAGGGGEDAGEEPPPTEAMDAVELERDPPAGAAAGSVPPASAAAGPDSDDPASELDSLFGDAQFREYDPGIAPIVAENPFRRVEPVGTEAPASGKPARRLGRAKAARATGLETPLRGHSAGGGASVPPSASGSVAFARLSHEQKILLGILAGLLTLLAVVALFFVGMRTSSAAGSASAATPAPSSSKISAPAFVPGPISPGRHGWNELRGGECLASYDGPWAPTFTVVDCDRPHEAQLVFRGVFTAASGAYPGADVLAADVVKACTAAGAIDLTKARTITDAQIAESYPATAEDWKDGSRSYFCFVDRAGEDPLTGTIAVPQKKAPAPYLVGPTPSASPAPVP
ncbi:MAG TPA: septum formation family protein [Pseudolysinimonas sp.]|nr:septum formation family protein [Pseudolysinimonas sp.]